MEFIYANVYEIVLVVLVLLALWVWRMRVVEKRLIREICESRRLQAEKQAEQKAYDEKMEPHRRRQQELDTLRSMFSRIGDDEEELKQAIRVMQGTRLTFEEMEELYNKARPWCSGDALLRTALTKAMLDHLESKQK